MIKNKYNYPDLERVDLERGRHYIDSTGTPVPSVTTILSGTSTKDGIEQWKRRVGEKEAERILALLFMNQLKNIYMEMSGTTFLIQEQTLLQKVLPKNLLVMD